MVLEKKYLMTFFVENRSFKLCGIFYDTKHCYGWIYLLCIHDLWEYYRNTSEPNVDLASTPHLSLDCVTGMEKGYQYIVCHTGYSLVPNGKDLKYLQMNLYMYKWCFGSNLQ